MNITITRVGEQLTFAEFADKHGLEMQVAERTIDDYIKRHKIARWCAHFKHAEVKGPGILSSVSGNGDTPEQAIADYARQLPGQLLVIDAFRPTRREIQCPNEWIEETK